MYLGRHRSQVNNQPEDWLLQLFALHSIRAASCCESARIKRSANERHKQTSVCLQLRCLCSLLFKVLMKTVGTEANRGNGVKDQQRIARNVESRAISRPHSAAMQKRCFSPRIKMRFVAGTGEPMTDSAMLFSDNTSNLSLAMLATNTVPSSRGA